MAEANDTMGILYQNLVDAGCSEKDINCCMDMAQNGKWVEMLPALRRHRVVLLEGIHNEQGKLDCLDYLIYKIGKKHCK